MIIKLVDHNQVVADYECPEGTFVATLTAAYAVTSKQGKPAIKFQFLVFDEATGRHHKVGKEFEINQNIDNPLKAFLADWLGAEYFAGGLVIDTDNLQGMEADIVTRHHQNTNPARLHSFPFVELAAIGPVGALTGLINSKAA